MTADARPKRIATSTKRTTAWLDACLELHRKHQQQQVQQQQEEQGCQQQQHAGQAGQEQQQGADGVQATAGDGEQGPGSGSGSVPGPLAGSIVLAALGGGAVEAERARAAKAVAEKEGVGGEARVRRHGSHCCTVRQGPCRDAGVMLMGRAGDVRWLRRGRQGRGCEEAGRGCVLPRCCAPHGSAGRPLTRPRPVFSQRTADTPYPAGYALCGLPCRAVVFLY